MPAMNLLRRYSIAAWPLVTIAGAVSPSACAYGCDDYLGPALTIEIVDSRTRQPVAAGSTIAVVGRTFTDTVAYGSNASENSRRYVVDENEMDAGLYLVLVRKPGHETWSRPVQVTTNRCHVRPVALEVELRAMQ